MCMDCNSATFLKYTLKQVHILGHCISCYKNKRGAEYCQLAQQHKAVWATACYECEQCHKMSTRIASWWWKCILHEQSYLNRVRTPTMLPGTTRSPNEVLLLKTWRNEWAICNRVHGALQWPQMGRLVSMIHSTDRMWLHILLRKVQQHTVKWDRSGEDERKTLHMKLCMVARL